MIKAAIIGATGYTGSELVRILGLHPEVDIKAITSESHAGKKFSEIHPQFLGLCDVELISTDDLQAEELDVLFLALPHGVSMEYVQKLEGYDLKIIDLSGDYRLSSPQVYEAWYQKTHSHTSAFDRAVYGLPELHKTSIVTSNLVANPGCFPTGSILALAPLFAENMTDSSVVIIDAKTGVTGAGIKASATTHFSNANDNFKAYGLKHHRHTIEIEEQLSALKGSGVQVQFTPHLLPVDRGILSTIYVKPEGSTNEKTLKDLYHSFYKDAPFVRMRTDMPDLKNVRATNFCDLHVTFDDRTGNILLISAIDNLVKGAAGQAVHNMNLQFDLKETMGLQTYPIKP